MPLQRPLKKKRLALVSDSYTYKAAILRQIYPRREKPYLCLEKPYLEAVLGTNCLKKRWDLKARQGLKIEIPWQDESRTYLLHAKVCDDVTDLEMKTALSNCNAASAQFTADLDAEEIMPIIMGHRVVHGRPYVLKPDIMKKRHATRSQGIDTTEDESDFDVLKTMVQEGTFDWKCPVASSDESDCDGELHSQGCSDGKRQRITTDNALEVTTIRRPAAAAAAAAAVRKVARSTEPSSPFHFGHDDLEEEEEEEESQSLLAPASSATFLTPPASGGKKGKKARRQSSQVLLASQQFSEDTQRFSQLEEDVCIDDTEERIKSQLSEGQYAMLCYERKCFKAITGRQEYLYSHAQKGLEELGELRQQVQRVQQVQEAIKDKVTEEMQAVKEELLEKIHSWQKPLLDIAKKTEERMGYYDKRFTVLSGFEKPTVDMSKTEATLLNEVLEHLPFSTVKSMEDFFAKLEQRHWKVLKVHFSNIKIVDDREFYNKVFRAFLTPGLEKTSVLFHERVRNLHGLHKLPDDFAKLLVSVFQASFGLYDREQSQVRSDFFRRIGSEHAKGRKRMTETARRSQEKGKNNKKAGIATQDDADETALGTEDHAAGAASQQDSVVIEGEEDTLVLPSIPVVEQLPRAREDAVEKRKQTDRQLAEDLYITSDDGDSEEDGEYQATQVNGEYHSQILMTTTAP